MPVHFDLAIYIQHAFSRGVVAHRAPAGSQGVGLVGSLNADDCSRHFTACFAVASAFAALSAWSRRNIERRLVSHLPWSPSLMPACMAAVCLTVVRDANPPSLVLCGVFGTSFSINVLVL